MKIGKKFGIMVVALVMLALAFAVPASAVVLSEKDLSVVRITQNTTTSCMFASSAMLYKYYGHESPYSYSYIYVNGDYNHDGYFADNEWVPYMDNNLFTEAVGYNVTHSDGPWDNWDSIFHNQIMYEVSLNSPESLSCTDFRLRKRPLQGLPRCTRRGECPLQNRLE